LWIRDWMNTNHLMIQLTNHPINESTNKVGGIIVTNSDAENHETEDRFKRALEHYQTGEIHEAEKICKEICHDDPGHSPALHLLGMMASHAGLYDVAVDQMSRAVQLSPDTPFFHNDLGNVFLAQGRIDEAIACYRNALRLDPNIVQAYYHLGVALIKKDLLDEALQSLEIAIKLKPDYTDALYQSGIILSQKDKHDEAISRFEKLLEIEPARHEALFALGVALGAVDRTEEAIACYHNVLETAPNHVYALNNLGLLLKEQGFIDQAKAAYQRAIEISPDLAGPHWNLSHVLLLTGNLQAGWKEFEWRLRKVDWQTANLRPCKVPLWHGESFAGKTLFIHDEQGLGDTIQFVRYLPMVKALGGDIIFETQEALIGLFKDFPGIDRLIPRSPDGVLPTDMDFYVPLLSLPAIFNTTLDTIPDTVPYLHADADKTRYWRERLPGDGFKVGIVWAGGPKNPNERNRSCRLRQFESIANISGVRLIGMQKGKAAEQVKDLPAGMEVINYGPELEDFTDTMALIENLDLIIAVDTAVAHLAGAMGKPIWLVLTFAHHWPWLLNRTDSPWYPSMRIYRQKKKGDWEPVFKQVGKDLQTRIPEKESAKRDMGQTLQFNKIKSCRHGIVCYNQNDMYIGKSFDLYGEFSEEESALFRRIVTDKDVVLDIGANIGAHTLFLAKAVGPNGQVHAFEPQRIVFQTLCANMALNHIANAFCYDIALGKRPGTVFVPQLRPWDHSNFGGLSLGNHQLGDVVEVKTIDSLNLSACSFIKIDTEGMELDVLMGAANTIKTLQPILYVENDRKDKSAALIQYIDSLGYDMYWHKPPLYNPQNFFNNPKNVFGDIVSLNMICLPRSRGGVLQQCEKVVVPK